MKKLKRKISRSKHTSKRSVRHKRFKYNAGALGAGMAYVVLALLIIMAAGAMMIGSVVPKSQPPERKQEIIILSPASEQGKDNLQLYTFPAMTITATPEPTNPTQIDEKSQWNKGNQGTEKNKDGGGGSGDSGGSSSPGGGGDGSGSGGGKGSGDGSSGKPAAI